MLRTGLEWKSGACRLPGNPSEISTGRVGCRTCSEKHYRHALARAQIRRGAKPSTVHARAGASGDGLQHPPRLPDPEIVERRQVDVDGDHRAHREVGAEAGEEGRDRRRRPPPRALGRTRDRRVEPRVLDPLEPGEQRVDPGGSAGGHAPVDEHDLAARAPQQVVDADVPVRDVRHRPGGVLAQHAGPVVGVGRAATPAPASRRGHRPASARLSAHFAKTWRDVDQVHRRRHVALPQHRGEPVGPRARTASSSASSREVGVPPLDVLDEQRDPGAVVVRRQQPRPQLVLAEVARARRSRGGTGPGCRG